MREQTGRKGRSSEEETEEERDQRVEEGVKRKLKRRESDERLQNEEEASLQLLQMHRYKFYYSSDFHIASCCVV